MNAPFTLRTATAPTDKAYDDIRWAAHLRMLNEPWRIMEAATGERHWNPDEVDLDDLDYRLNDKLDGDLTRLERADCEGAQMAIDTIRGDRVLRDCGP